MDRRSFITKFVRRERWTEKENHRYLKKKKKRNYVFQTSRRSKFSVPVFQLIALVERIAQRFRAILTTPKRDPG